MENQRQAAFLALTRMEQQVHRKGLFLKGVGPKGDLVMGLVDLLKESQSVRCVSRWMMCCLIRAMRSAKEAPFIKKMPV